MNDIIRIGTRKSALALIQTQLVADELRQVCPGIQVEIVTKDTLGDRILDKPLQEFGGKGVFVSEFEQAIQEGVIDLAVHSAKDLPMELAQGLTIAAVSGDLNRIKRFVKVLAFVNSADDFGMQPQVVNGGSNLIAGLFGEEAGLPARSAIGTNALPGGIACEIEVLVELK